MDDNNNKSKNVLKYKYLSAPKELEIMNEFKKPSMLNFMKDNFIVVIGIGVTVSALINGLRHLVKGNKMEQQYMMRLRVGGQAFAIFALIGTAAYKSLYEKKKII